MLIIFIITFFLRTTDFRYARILTNHKYKIFLMFFIFKYRWNVYFDIKKMFPVKDN